MSRLSNAAAAGLLTVALAALALPLGVNLASALVPPAPAASPPTAPLPDAQQLPGTITGLRDIAPLPQAAPMPDPATLSRQMEELLVADGGGNFTALVQDAATGQVLYSRNAAAPRIPASNLKLLTALAALRGLGADTKLSTRTLLGSAPGTVVLAAGGDVLLGAGDSNPDATVGRAGLATLATQTAAALRADGTPGPVQLILDDTLFAGPHLHPEWAAGDIEAGEIAPIYPLALYGARTAPGAAGPRPADAAAAAADVFAAALRDQGVEVTGPVQRGTGGGQTLAEVQSASIGEQVAYLLQESDNYVAEAMGRLTAVAAHQEASFDGAAAAITAGLTAVGLKMDGLVLGDSCGLAVNDRVSAEQLTQAIRIMASDPRPDLRAALAGLPVAGLSGTLGTRYQDPTTAAGAGLVRAKTGTLNAVLSLTGYVVDADSRLLVFSFLGNDLAGGSTAAKPAVDRAAATLAACGCRG
jgi:D-alanyl-D-alanine carboxypeptidase/D-alanyl-D-alanine-endopeptidase (penicillin-binding protein 4)